MSAAKNQGEVEHLVAHGPYRTLGEGVRLRRSDRCEHHPGSLRAEHLVEGASVLGVSVPDEEAKGFVGLAQVEGDKVARLLSDEGCIGVLAEPVM